ncbi:hypothetical protein PR048_025545 [Dryococelus australis]|uniref:Uncharacterized protein n=1 Tax=Dryococelus australis TaxID=614101 RepID=A0ABQ9GRR9_9NEOP|nr:hypothetical protein PR048_025545 [Dryococelus australis]
MFTIARWHIGNTLDSQSGGREFDPRHDHSDLVVPECKDGENRRFPRKPVVERHCPTWGDPDRDQTPITLAENKLSGRLTAAAPVFIMKKNVEQRLCSSVDFFNIKQDCLYCGEEASIRKESKKEVKFRKTICEVTTLPFKDSVIAQALERGDAWGKIIHARAVSVVDLVAAEAKYHKQCQLLFASTSMPPAHSLAVILVAYCREHCKDCKDNKTFFRGRERPEDECRAFVFTKLCAYMDSAEDSQFLQGDLVETMKNFNTNNPNDSVCTAKYLKKKLKARYGNSVFTTELSGKSSIVNLKGSASSILHGKWYLDKKNTEEEENIHINPYRTWHIPLNGRCAIYYPSPNPRINDRLLHPSSADTRADRGKLQVNCYKKSALPGLKGINIRELATVSDASTRSVKNAIVADVLCTSARWSEESSAPPWNELCEHTLTSQALITMILEMENLFGVYQEELHKLFLEVSTGEKMIPDAAKSPVLYLRQVDILRLFIRAERSGDWELHLKCVWSMLPYLHAAGHIHYAKSPHLYVQQMEELPSRMPPHEYNKFTSEDLSIEQDLMLALKTEGGLTRGRGITESTLAYFVAAFPVCLKLCNALEELSDIKAGSSEQHVELRDSRRTRDARDVAILLSWLKEHSPCDVDCLQSLASGIVGYDSINCDQAEYVGLGAIKCIIGSTFGEVKHTQKNRVKPLSKEVIDGWHLLHVLVWPRPATYGQIADAYLGFVQKHYRVSVTVVFDGYDVQSTKSQQHFRRASKRTSAEIMFGMITSASTTQADFLNNHHNKERLITLLSHHFETAGIKVCNSEGDADTLIVKRALELASVGNNVTVVASDTDVVVMLLARTTDDMELRVLRPGTSTKCDKVYNVREIQEKIRESKDSVLFCHTVTGCDTKSDFLGKVFNSPESMKEEVCAAGEKFVIALYGRINVNSLDELKSGNWLEDSWFQYRLAGHQHLSLYCAWFPVAVRHTVVTGMNAGMLDWPAGQCVDIVEEEVA